jgi:hypothetical protein
MGYVASDDRVEPRGARCAGAFKDGPFIRRVVTGPFNTLTVKSTEGEVLWTEYACPVDYQIMSIDCETSSFSGGLVLILGGFTPGGAESRTITIVTDYQIQPPTWYRGEDRG